MLASNTSLTGLLGLAPRGAARCPCDRGARRAPRASPSAHARGPSFRVRRALTPWRSQTSSSASRLSNFSCWTRLVGEPSSFFAGSRRSRRATTSAGRDRARRSAWRAAAETRGRASRRPPRLDSRRGTSSSHVMASMSRWLVGSSSSSRSGCPTSARASRTRRRHPPESVSTSASGGR